jgi:hypothetical protein
MHPQEVGNVVVHSYRHLQGAFHNAEGVVLEPENQDWLYPVYWDNGVDQWVQLHSMDMLVSQVRAGRSQS